MRGPISAPLQNPPMSTVWACSAAAPRRVRRIACVRAMQTVYTPAVRRRGTCASFASSTVDSRATLGAWQTSLRSPIRTILTDRQLRSAGSASKFYTSNAISLQRPRVFAEGVVREATAVHGNMPLEPVDEGPDRLRVRVRLLAGRSASQEARGTLGSTCEAHAGARAFIQAQARRNESIKNGSDVDVLSSADERATNRGGPAGA